MTHIYKKVISLIIALFCAFGTILPIFAEGQSGETTSFQFISNENVFAVRDDDDLSSYYFYLSYQNQPYDVDPKCTFEVVEGADIINFPDAHSNTFKVLKPGTAKVKGTTENGLEAATTVVVKSGKYASYIQNYTLKYTLKKGEMLNITDDMNHKW